MPGNDVDQCGTIHVRAITPVLEKRSAIFTNKSMIFLLQREPAIGVPKRRGKAESHAIILRLGETGRITCLSVCRKMLDYKIDIPARGQAEVIRSYGFACCKIQCSATSKSNACGSSAKCGERRVSRETVCKFCML